MSSCTMYMYIYIIRELIWWETPCESWSWGTESCTCTCSQCFQQTAVEVVFLRFWYWVYSLNIKKWNCCVCFIYTCTCRWQFYFFIRMVFVWFSTSRSTLTRYTCTEYSLYIVFCIFVIYDFFSGQDTFVFFNNRKSKKVHMPITI